MKLFTFLDLELFLAQLKALEIDLDQWSINAIKDRELQSHRNFWVGN